MRCKPTVGSLVLAAAVAGSTLAAPAQARAQGHGHHGGVVVGVGIGFAPFWGWGAPYWGWGAPYWGWGWGPGPYGYGYAPGNGLLGYAMASGMGGLDVDVKPNRAEVWVDGRYVAEARELDGDPSYLWLKQGPHHVVIYKAGYKSFDSDVDVRTGVLRSLKLQLEKGDSQPPVAAPREARPPEARVESGASEGHREPPMGEPRADVPPPSGEPRGAVVLSVEPRDATVYVDGKYAGVVRELSVLQLAPGHHRLELARPGYRETSKEIDVEAGGRTRVELSLERGGGWKY
jgi:hypothetical protein